MDGCIAKKMREHKQIPFYFRKLLKRIVFWCLLCLVGVEISKRFSVVRLEVFAPQMQEKTDWTRAQHLVRFLFKPKVKREITIIIHVEKLWLLQPGLYCFLINDLLFIQLSWCSLNLPIIVIPVVGPTGNWNGSTDATYFKTITEISPVNTDTHTTNTNLSNKFFGHTLYVLFYMYISCDIS